MSIFAVITFSLLAVVILSVFMIDRERARKHVEQVENRTTPAREPSLVGRAVPGAPPLSHHGYSLIGKVLT